MVKKDNEVIEAVCDAEIRAAYASLLASDALLKAHRMRRLFRYLMDQALEGGRGNVSEYTIGIEVFDRRPEDFISEDPAIRVQVGRLRHRLAAYYTERAVSGDVEISIPVGRLTPVFRRIVRPEPPVKQDDRLLVQPIRYLTERTEGQAFASGLYEELINQLFSSFGDVFVREEAASGDAAPGTPRRLIEGSMRVDAERIRTSIRLVDYSLRRITWAQNFDRSVQFGIREQEELAASICHALREVVSM
ncbi:MAG: hypothetical protein GAK28_01783 [Luteibacter sp.]|uniref:hypothetical protein n=1 Tax=Luteibacter sp. TaxID=1886636 RepID=UPI001380F4CE|nr:hypothetical protein [Luteibacter sp.]KAF1007441.1 MAG: hypothetical protein GAK28_01783 [Luteibacter sp.]